jgi:protein-S-isoprenylcysteine O-methyltransferase Ste14
LVFWLQRNNPELLAERMKGPVQKDQKGWDKVFVLASLPVFLGLMVVPGLDAVRFGWSYPPMAVKIIGFVALIPAWGLVFLTMRANPYLSKAVKIQEEHKVVSSGPYGVVRHPMYVGVNLMTMAMPLALGSYWALIPAVLSILLICLRTALEDRTLHRELSGYTEYARRVRYRLVPGLW